MQKPHRPRKRLVRSQGPALLAVSGLVVSARRRARMSHRRQKTTSMTDTRPSRRRYAVALILLASCAAIAAPHLARAPAAGLPRYGMVVYSDLCVNDDSGEFGGQRITLQRFNEVDTVIYEYTAGGLSWPVVASDVNIDPRGRQLYFTVRPPDGEERTISGKLSADGQALTLDGGYCGDAQVPMRLKKVRDFGRKAGACKACPAPKVKASEPEPKSEPESKPDNGDRPMKNEAES